MKMGARASRMVSIAAVRGIYRANCLEKSLALWCILSRQGIESRILLGARKVDGSLDAHAWVELDRAILNDDDDVRSRYSAFVKLDGSGAFGI